MQGQKISTIFSVKGLIVSDIVLLLVCIASILSLNSSIQSPVWLIVSLVLMVRTIVFLFDIVFFLKLSCVICLFHTDSDDCYLCGIPDFLPDVSTVRATCVTVVVKLVWKVIEGKVVLGFYSD